MATFKKTEKIQKLDSKKKRTASSRQWLLRQLNDPYVAKARKDGYRSRAAYKLIEINDKYKFIKKGCRILDLGAAPGGWCQVAKTIVGQNGFVVGVDLQDMIPITDVTLLKGDFNDESIHHQIIDTFAGEKADVILSDMAASACGMTDVDHIRLMLLLESVYHFSFHLLRPGGSFIAKVLRGGTEKDLLAQLKQSFAKVTHFKPPSSRQESSELYVIAQGFRPAKGGNHSETPASSDNMININNEKL